jgi:hypothetical protein
VSADGGEENVVLARQVEGTNWTPGRGGIYFWSLEPLPRGERAAIQFFDLESGRTTELFREDGPVEHGWLAVSPDEEWILYGERSANSSELMLVENLR